MQATVARAPRFSAAVAEQIVWAQWGISAAATPLPSERDQNFRMDGEDGRRFVLKIANPDEERAVLALQNAAMAHVAAQAGGERLAPTALPSRSGVDLVEWPTGGVTYAVRLLSYLPGKPLALVRPQRGALLHSVGALFGKLDRALAHFDHPAAHREFHWDLQHARQTVTTSLPLLPEGQRVTVANFLQRYDDHVAPRLGALRMGVIHSDGNDYNVLATVADDWTLQAAGVIDFGDMVHSQIVNEPAIAAAYAMLDKADPLAAAADVVAGYHAHQPLTEDEVAVLWELMCMRLCVSVCLAARQHRAAPDNDYLLISQAPIWRLFAQIAGLSPQLAHYRLRAACGLTPCPQSVAVMEFLQRHAGQTAPIVTADLKKPGLLVLDLSVGSDALPGEMLAGGTTPLAAHIAGAMAETGASVAVGRYAEPRLLYRSEQFDAGGDELPERRTIHLGIDLFMQAGSPVCTPLPARVVSVCHNDAALDYGPTVILRHETDAGLPFFTLYGHLGLDVLDRLQPGQLLDRGERIGVIGESAVNGGWPPHLHLQLITDLVDLSGNFPGVARPSEQALWLSLCPDPRLLLGIPSGAFPHPGRSREEILASRRVHLGPNLSISYRNPLQIVRGWGQYLYDESGQAYLDVVNNVCHVGHCHPHVVAAGRRQMAVLNTNTRYLHSNLVEYAERLLAKFPEPLRVLFLVCSGSEANELALRLARTCTGRRDVIMLDAAYHGNTQALVDISPYKHDGPGGQGAPAWAHTALMPDPYRGPYKGYSMATGAAYADHVRRIAADLVEVGSPPAAFIAESVLGCGGQIVLPDGYLAAAFAHVRAVGGLCIADEVQVGFGRVGSRFWGWETQDVVPDIVTMGKPIGNGHPLAAVVTTEEIAAAFANGMEYFNTFGGNPVSCAIGSAVLDVIEQEQLQEHALIVGNQLMAGLQGLKARHQLIGDVRGLGLFVGVELVLDRQTLAPAPRHADYLANRMCDHGILISTDGPFHNVLKLKPPLVFSAADADRLVATLDKLLQEEPLQPAEP